MNRRTEFVVILLGAAVCFACLGIPNNGGILIGAMAGVTAGFLTDKAATRRAVPPASATGTGSAA